MTNKLCIWPELSFGSIAGVANKRTEFPDFAVHEVWFTYQHSFYGQCKLCVHMKPDQELICEIRPKNSARSIEDVVRIILEDNN